MPTSRKELYNYFGNPVNWRIETGTFEKTKTEELKEALALYEEITNYGVAIANANYTIRMKREKKKQELDQKLEDTMKMIVSQRRFEI